MIEKVQKEAQQGHYNADITVTGHSLGGTLAQINAHKFDLKGETFNAYGAAGLIGILPGQGQDQVVDWVRATDLVSAASPQFGQVRIVADAQDIEHLRQHGYTDRAGWFTPRDMVGEIRQDALGAHAISAFVPDAQGHTLLTPQNEALAQAHADAIGRYRDDVATSRTALSTFFGDEGLKLGSDAGLRVAHWAREGVDFAEDKLAQGAHAIAQAGRDVEQGANHLAQTADQSWNDFSQRLDRMLDSAKNSDWAGFRQDQQSFANMEPGRQLHENAVQTVNAQEHQATLAQQAQMAAQQQVAAQAAAQQGFAR